MSDPSAIEAFYDWVERHRGQPSGLAGEGLKGYFHGVAEARYVIRRIFRIVDEQAKSAGLEPLEHQALIQLFGAPEPLRVIDAQYKACKTMFGGFIEKFGGKNRAESFLASLKQAA